MKERQKIVVSLIHSDVSTYVVDMQEQQVSS